ncbi:MAG: cardiolipin synthase [Roseburia sp.]|nr:cardiolipin synthase [Roseburia sp.]
MEVKNMGLRLIKKGKKGLLSVIFSRFWIMAILIVLQFVALFAGIFWFAEYRMQYDTVKNIFVAIMVLYLLNHNMNSTAKITWLVLVMLFPVFGSLLFWFVELEIGHRVEKARLSYLVDFTKNSIQQDKEVLQKLSQESPETESLVHYLAHSGCFPIYDKTAVTYYPSGETKFEELLKQLEKAKKFIFLEYFIIEEGIMWGRVLEILAKKAAEGVEVRVMYDGTCESSLLPFDYPKRLEALGIKCKMFAPVTPFLSTHYNYRDHRKIVVIDGQVAFTGGVNLADEYINQKLRFGHWKDTAIMVRGEAVKSFTLMFLQMWNLEEKNPDFYKYINVPVAPIEEANGYVVPYGDCPLDDDKTGERVYMDILNRANKYVHIMTPYLILDGEMETALRFAAKRGVDVKIILPAIPDKKSAFALAKSHYKHLLEAGVKIYEYTPGFVHAKVFTSDDCKAVVGTINLDYRSLYHHYECAAYMYQTDCIADIERDFEETLEKCARVTKETIKKEKLGVKLAGWVFKVVAPLM